MSATGIPRPELRELLFADGALFNDALAGPLLGAAAQLMQLLMAQSTAAPPGPASH